MAVEEKLFVRKATGLVREIGFITAIILVITNVVGLGWQKRAFQFSGLAPLPENQYLAGIPPMTMAFILGGIAILLSVLAVSILSAAMPRSGGGYVVISRTVGPLWGSLGAWLQFLGIAFSFGLIAVAVFEGIYLIIGPTAGFSLATPQPTDLFLFGAGVGLVILFTVVAAFGIKLAGLLLQAMFVIPAVLTFYVFGLLSQANSDSVTRGLSQLFGATPQQYVDAATNQAMASSLGGMAIQEQAASVGGYWGAVATAMVGAYFAYIGYAASTFVAGEVKEANKSLPRVLLIASLLIIALYVSISLAATGALKGVAPVCVTGSTVNPGQCTGSGLEYSLLSAWSYLSHGGPIGAPPLGDLGLPTVGLWTTTVAAVTANGIGLGTANALLVIFGVFWIANDIPPFILTASRILFAMSFDRVLPSPLASVNDRFHSPVNAVIVTGIVGVIGCLFESALFDVGGTLNPKPALGVDPSRGSLFLAALFGSGGGVAITDFLDNIFFILFTLSLVILPLRASKRQIFDTAPYKPGGKWGMVAIGLAGLGANLFIAEQLLFAPRGTFNLLGAKPDLLVDLWSVWFTIILSVVGIVLYFVHRMRRGINYSTIFAQIPPE